MTASPTKQTVLKNIAEKIKVLQDAYKTIEQLPNEVFGEVEPVPALSTNEHTPVNGSSHPEITRQAAEQSEEQEHGYIRKSIVSIIGSEKRPLRKSEIIGKFLTAYPFLSEERAQKAVTYAITGLQDSGQIKGYKPQGVIMKGNYWTLTDWWEGQRLKNEYKPNRELFK